MNTIVENIEQEYFVPGGWEIMSSDSITTPEMDNANKDDYAKVLANHLSLATNAIEHFTAALKRRFGITIAASYININSLNAFHVCFLVNEATFLQPEMFAAKLLAAQHLGMKGPVAIQFKFASAAEYMKNQAFVSNFRYKIGRIAN